MVLLLHISGHAIVAIMAILTILAIMVRLNMAKDMTIICVYGKNRKNVDQPRKRN